MNIQDFLNGFLGSIPIAAVAIFLVRHFLNKQEKEYDKSTSSIEAMMIEINNIKIKLAEIQGDIREAISIKSTFKDMEKSVWKLDSQMIAAFKILDRDKQ